VYGGGDGKCSSVNDATHLNHVIYPRSKVLESGTWLVATQSFSHRSSASLGGAKSRFNSSHILSNSHNIPHYTKHFPDLTLLICRPTAMLLHLKSVPGGSNGMYRSFLTRNLLNFLAIPFSVLAACSSSNFFSLSLQNALFLLYALLLFRVLSSAASVHLAHSLFVHD
jgi:hypothetical protein